jgi:hypothetical protein
MTTMREYLITIIHGQQRTQRRVIASNTCQAAITGANMIGETDLPLTIFCKPMERIAQWQPAIAA